MLDEKLRCVLEMYPVDVKNVSRARGAYLCHSPSGLFLLKAYPYSENHLIYESMLKSTLIDRGCVNIDALLYNKEGQLCSPGKDGKNYVLKRWYDGHECDLNDWAQVAMTMKHLAQMHVVMSNIHFECHWMAHARGISATELFGRRNRELRAIRGYVRNKKDKNTFELLYMKYYDKYESQAYQAGDVLREACYDELYRESIERGMFCHGDYSHHHVLINKNQLAAVNFDKSVRNVQIQDLYYFMRKALEKNNWDEDYGMHILESYDKIRQLTAQEKRCLYGLLLYPEKYWKIANHYYNSRKSWRSEQNMEKLKKYIEQQERRDKFLERASQWGRIMSKDLD